MKDRRLDFRINEVDLRRKYLWIGVRIFPRRSDVVRSQPSWCRHKKTLAYFSATYPVNKRRKGCIGTITLCRDKMLELCAMHESVHAAFEISRHGRKWPVEEDLREEFIARTAEYIFKQIMRRIRKQERDVQ